jgi:hypothetical protein
MGYVDRKKRLHVSTDVFINRTVKAEGLDLSEDGMYLYTRHPYIEGSIVEVSFKLEGDAIDVSAKVVHTQPGIGCGVRFEDFKDSSLQKIKQYVDKFGAPAPEIK